MKSRIEYAQVVPDAIEALRALENYVRTCGIEPKAVELIKIRASQINGCAHCLDMHTKDARARGETEQRIYALNAWRETPFSLRKNVRRWPGRKRSRRFPRRTSQMKFMKLRDNVSMKRNSWISRSRSLRSTAGTA